MKVLHARTLAIKVEDACKILGVDFYQLKDVHILPPRIDHGVACFDFVSDESFTVGPMESLKTVSGHPLCHYRPFLDEDDGA